MLPDHIDQIDDFMRALGLYDHEVSPFNRNLSQIKTVCCVD